MTERILVIGACGQLGSELTLALRSLYGTMNVVASDINQAPAELQEGPFEILNVLDPQRLAEIVKQHQITQIYHLAALLSATGEKNPKFAWELNMNSLLYVLDIAKERKLHKVYWPSSIAAFGPHTHKDDTPQYTIMDPNTVYGISKLAGERWCEYYFQKYGVDVRSLRYPGLIGYKTPPGGGTTDYAVDIYYKAVKKEPFTSFLNKGTYLPMMYMPDAIRGTIELMTAPAEQVKIRSSYNLSAMSFDPEEVAASIRKIIPGFTIDYKADFRQEIANSWPQHIDDTAAREDWAWSHEFDLDAMSEDMIKNLRLMFPS